jgi:hypothetical protein
MIVSATRRIFITLILPFVLLVWVGAPGAAATLRTVLGFDAGQAFTLEWTADGDTNGEQLGYAVGTAGDVNGDGIADVIVGAPYDTQDFYREGTVYVYHGSTGGLPNSNFPADWKVSSGQQGTFFGGAVSTAGDVNGDGCDDVIIGARDYKNPIISTGTYGAAFVYYGAPTGLSATPGWTLLGEQKDSYLGISASTAGDVNGDGYADVVIGASGYPNGGLALVFLGATDGLTNTHSVTLTVGQSGAQFGLTVSYAGDLNGDGFDDIIVGAPGYDVTGTADVGGVFVYFGAAEGISATYTALYGDQTGSRFGITVSGAGDVNGDGYDDIIVGAQLYNQKYTNEGAAFIYLGSPTGVLTTPQRMLVGGQAYAQFGASVGTAGDVNNDGYSDVVIGASRYTYDQREEGAAFVYLGSAAGVDAQPVWRGEGNKSETFYGLSAGTAGDVNNDGYVDLIVGAPEYKTEGDNKRGRVFVYHGTGNTGGYHVIYLPLVLRSNF